MNFDALLAVAALAAFAGAVTRDTTAMILLVSFVVSKAMCELHVPFEPLLWLSIDIVAASVIVRHDSPTRDWIIVAMFFPAAVLYFTQPTWWPFVVNSIVAAQLFLTFPMGRANAFINGAMAYLTEHRDDRLKFVTAKAF